MDTNNDQPQKTADTPQVDNETLKAAAPEIARIRSQVQEKFGKIILSMMVLSRYKNQSLQDLHHLVLDPLLRDRVAIAYPVSKEGEDDIRQHMDATGFAIWASVSEAVDLNIREQIKNKVFPVRLKPQDWDSGEIKWVMDVIAPNKKMASTVLANFNQIAKSGSLRLHPLINTLVEEELLSKMGAEKMSKRAQKRDSGQANSERKPANGREKPH